MLVRPVVLDPVLRETHDQHHDSAGYQSSESLDDAILNDGRLIEAAARSHHRRSECLQEIAAERASGRAGNGMPEPSEAVLLHERRSRMPAENTGDELNDEICNSPRHRAGLSALPGGIPLPPQSRQLSP